MNENRHQVQLILCRVATEAAYASWYKLYCHKRALTSWSLIKKLLNCMEKWFKMGRIIYNWSFVDPFFPNQQCNCAIHCAFVSAHFVIWISLSDLTDMQR